MTRFRTGALVALTLLVAACTTAPGAPTPAASGVPSGAPSGGAGGLESTTLRILQGSTPDFTQVAIVKWVALLEENHGLTVTFENVESGQVVTRALVAGTGDVAIAPLSHVIALHQETDEDVRVLVVDAQTTDYVLLSQPDITSVEELAGRTFGINSPGDPGDTAPKAALRELGFDVAQLETVEIGGTSARVAALVAGQIDSAAAHTAEAYAALEGTELSTLLVTGDALQDYLQTGLLSTGPWLEGHPNLAQVVVDELVEAIRWAEGNKREYLELASEVVPDLSEDIKSRAYDTFKQIDLFAVNGGLAPEQVENYLRIEQESGLLEGELPESDAWLDTTYLEDYLTRNGER